MTLVATISTFIFFSFFCQTPVLGLGLGVDFTFAWDNNNNNNNKNKNRIIGIKYRKNVKNNDFLHFYKTFDINKKISRISKV